MSCTVFVFWLLLFVPFIPGETMGSLLLHAQVLWWHCSFFQGAFKDRLTGNEKSKTWPSKVNTCRRPIHFSVRSIAQGWTWLLMWLALVHSEMDGCIWGTRFLWDSPRRPGEDYRHCKWRQQHDCEESVPRPSGTRRLEFKGNASNFHWLIKKVSY